jgi:hypothetical protein
MTPSGIVIETARLRLRALRENDLTELVALIGNWEVARWVSSVPHPYSETDGREWIAIVRQDHATGYPRRFAIALKETDQVIGGVGCRTLGRGRDSRWANTGNQSTPHRPPPRCSGCAHHPGRPAARDGFPSAPCHAQVSRRRFQLFWPCQTAR